MPPGPKPKDDAQRERRNAPTFETVELEQGATVETPELPGRPGGEPWSEWTLRWYGKWRVSPMAAQLLEVDWERLFAVALLWEAFLVDRRPAILSEIRLNEAKLGGTPDDRLRLRWRLKAARRDEEQADRAADAASTERSRAKGDPRLALVREAS